MSRDCKACGEKHRIVKRGLAGVIILPIRGYQRFISPLLAPRCRFYPTCSHYAIEAVQTHGAFKGMWLALCRVLRCHPLHPGGDDPVPPARPESRKC